MQEAGSKDAEEAGAEESEEAPAGCSAVWQAAGSATPHYTVFSFCVSAADSAIYHQVLGECR